MTTKKMPEINSSPSSNENVQNSRGLTSGRLVTELAEMLRNDPFWSGFFRDQERTDWGLHVAIFREPFLTWVLDGRKRVESRFSQNQVAPFGEVHIGDVIALKRVAGPIVGLCLVNATWSYRLDPKTWTYIRDHFSPLLCADNEEFWSSRKDARFATLISLDHVQSIPQIQYPKSDRRGWVVERGRSSQQVLNL
jgi:hypothetical protein